MPPHKTWEICWISESRYSQRNPKNFPIEISAEIDFLISEHLKSQVISAKNLLSDIYQTNSGKFHLDIEKSITQFWAFLDFLVNNEVQIFLRNLGLDIRLISRWDFYI